ncbi:MAG: GDP-mannose 4,6-dehydratase [Carboxydocellales bacterium]
MKILVTGGAGFIGSHITERLLLEEHEIVIVDNFNNYYDPLIKRKNIKSLLENKNIPLYEGDITHYNEMKEIFEKEQIKRIVHLAAWAGVRPSIQNPLLYEEVNVLGTINLLELSRLYNIENFVFGSSSSVYGINSKVPFSENDPIEKPISPYATTKRSGELHCFTYSHLYDLPVSCLRFFTVYGPRQRPEMAIHKFTRLIANGEEVPIFGDGTTQRDYTFYSDIVDGIYNALLNINKFEIFNLGNSETVELNYLITLIERSLGKKANIIHYPEQPGDVPITFADTRKASDMLGYRPKVSIEEGIEIFVDWYKTR